MAGGAGIEPARTAVKEQCLSNLAIPQYAYFQSMKYLVLILCVFLSGCTQTKGCQDQVAVAKIAAQVVALKLNCGNVDQIETDLEASAAKVAFCAPTPSPTPVQAGKLGNIFVNSTTCKFFGSMAVSDLVSHNIPDSWMCETSLLTQPLDQIVTKACNSYF